MSQGITHLDILTLMFGRSDFKRTSPFGEKGWPRKHPHDGTDYATPVGLPIRFPFDSVVTFENYGVKEAYIDKSRGERTDYGNHTGFYFEEFDHTLMVAHTMYESSEVKVEQTYKKGDFITKTGNTGLSSGPHTHIGIAEGKITSLREMREKAVNFEGIVFWPGWKEEGESEAKPTPTPEPSFTPYGFHIPAGATLYTREGKEETIKTTNPHDVTILEEVNGLGRFKASWLVGTDQSYVKLKEDKPAPAPKPEFINHVNRMVVIKPGSLRDANGNVEAIKTTKEHTVSVLEQKGNGIDRENTLLKFTAPWLIGVTESWVRLADTK